MKDVFPASSLSMLAWQDRERLVCSISTKLARPLSNCLIGLADEYAIGFMDSAIPWIPTDRIQVAGQRRLSVAFEFWTLESATRLAPDEQCLADRTIPLHNPAS